MPGTGARSQEERILHDTHGSILDREHGALTLGIVIVITMVAFEGLALTTVTPVIADALGGLSLYVWIGSTYLLAQLVGSVWAGREIDQRGLTLPFVVSLSLFGVGLVVAAAAQRMEVLVVGRALQGLGAGALANCTYTSVSLGYADAMRPRMFAVISTAYIVPAMVGPYTAALLAERLSWRSVFLVLLPFLPVAALLALPAFRRLTTGGNAPTSGALPAAVQLAVGAGMLLAGVGMLPGLPGFFLAAAGVALCVRPLRSLMPEGTFLALPVLPAALAARGLFATAFFTTETYVVLALTRVAGHPESTAGLVVTVTSLSWAVGTGLQARLDRRDEGRGRNGRVLAGVGVMALGIVVVQPVVWAPGLALPLALAAHIILGLGIGLAHPTSGLIAFARAPRGAEGAVTSYLLLADLFTPAVGIGVGGALVAIADASGLGVRTGVAAALGLSLLLILLGLVASYRLFRAADQRSAGRVAA